MKILDASLGFFWPSFGLLKWNWGFWSISWERGRVAVASVYHLQFHPKQQPSRSCLLTGHQKTCAHINGCLITCPHPRQVRVLEHDICRLKRKTAWGYCAYHSLFSTLPPLNLILNISNIQNLPRVPQERACHRKPLFSAWRCDLLLWFGVLLRKMPFQVREGSKKYKRPF